MNKRNLNVERSVKKVKYIDRGDNKYEDTLEQKVTIAKQDHGDSKMRDIKHYQKFNCRSADLDTPLKIENIDHITQEVKKNKKESLNLDKRLTANDICDKGVIKREVKANVGIIDAKLVNSLQPNSKIKPEEQLSSKTSSKAGQETQTQTMKPAIKTLISKNDSSKVIKSITFVEQKKPTQLHVKIPTELVNRKNKMDAPKHKDKMANRKSDKRREKDARCHRVKIDGKNDVSPPTEVAKWVPASVNKHTKPYYEAWVNTTLTAVSKDRKHGRIIIDKPKSQSEVSEPIYENFKDEKFIGRIRITHR